MDRLEQIKNEVARENEYPDWNSASRHLEDNMPYRSCLETEGLVNEVARRYASEMIRHNLERAAAAARTRTNDESTSIIVDKESITSLEIELI